MPGTALFGEVYYVLADLVVAAYDAVADTYSTPIALAVGQSLMIEPRADNDELRSYGAISNLLSIPVACDFTLSAGALDRNAFAAMTGSNNYTSGLTPNRVVTVDLKAGQDGDLPYFGILGVGIADGGGRVVGGLQKCKLNTQPNFSIDGKENKFVIQEIEGVAAPVTRSSINMNLRLKIYETASDLTVPATADNFKAFFTSPAVA